MVPPTLPKFQISTATVSTWVPSPPAHLGRIRQRNFFGSVVRRGLPVPGGQEIGQPTSKSVILEPRISNQSLHLMRRWPRSFAQLVSTARQNTRQETVTRRLLFNPSATLGSRSFNCFLHTLPDGVSPCSRPTPAAPCPRRPKARIPRRR